VPLSEDALSRIAHTNLERLVGPVGAPAASGKGAHHG
jgi:hypothetical protein